jgi:hypothetical protein
MGMIGAFFIKKIDVKTLEEQETDDSDTHQFDQLINTSII